MGVEIVGVLLSGVTAGVVVGGVVVDVVVDEEDTVGSVMVVEGAGVTAGVVTTGVVVVVVEVVDVVAGVVVDVVGSVIMVVVGLSANTLPGCIAIINNKLLQIRAFIVTDRKLYMLYLVIMIY